MPQEISYIFAKTKKRYETASWITNCHHDINHGDYPQLETNNANIHKQNFPASRSKWRVVSRASNWLRGPFCIRWKINFDPGPRDTSVFIYARVTYKVHITTVLFIIRLNFSGSHWGSALYYFLPR